MGNDFRDDEVGLIPHWAKDPKLEDERGRIIKRTREVAGFRQARGVKMGRKPKLNELQKAEERKRLPPARSQTISRPSYDVSRATIARLATELLFRVDPDRNMARFYKIDVQPMLFGEIGRDPRTGPHRIERQCAPHAL
jgi:hypothetical protein